VSTLDAIREVLRQLEHEAVGHLNEWAEERPRDGTGGAEAERSADVFRRAAVEAFAVGSGTWRALAMDRLMAAFSETDHVGLREALLDAAGLLVAWTVDLERREPRRALERPLERARETVRRTGGL